uniref:Uncharacterized protein n=1 Tax=Steinernema glaseri TaxID=37863 RepID=A0A1I8AGU6_9BILA
MTFFSCESLFNVDSLVCAASHASVGTASNKEAGDEFDWCGSAGVPFAYNELLNSILLAFHGDLNLRKGALER